MIRTIQNARAFIKIIHTVSDWMVHDLTIGLAQGPPDQPPSPARCPSQHKDNKTLLRRLNYRAQIWGRIFRGKS